MKEEVREFACEKTKAMKPFRLKKLVTGKGYEAEQYQCSCDNYRFSCTFRIFKKI